MEQHPSSVAVAVTAVRPEGGINIGYGTNDAGHPVLFAGCGAIREPGGAVHLDELRPIASSLVLALVDAGKPAKAGK